MFLPGDGHVFRNLSEAIVSGKLPLDSVMYQDIANTADNIKESWTTRFRTWEPLRAWFLAVHDEQSGARAIKGMRGPMGFRRNTIRFDSVHQLRINKFAPYGHNNTHAGGLPVPGLLACTSNWSARHQ